MKESLNDFMNRVAASVEAGDVLLFEDQERLFNVARQIAILTMNYLNQVNNALGDEL